MIILLRFTFALLQRSALRGILKRFGFDTGHSKHSPIP